MRVWLVALGFVAACRYPPLAEIPDAVVDASPCLGSLVPVCFTRLPRAIDLVTQSIDTDSSSLCDKDNDQLTRYWCAPEEATFLLVGCGNHGTL